MGDEALEQQRRATASDRSDSLISLFSQANIPGFLQYTLFFFETPHTKV